MADSSSVKHKVLINVVNMYPSLVKGCDKRGFVLDILMTLAKKLVNVFELSKIS